MRFSVGLLKPMEVNFVIGSPWARWWLYPSLALCRTCGDVVPWASTCYLCTLAVFSRVVSNFALLAVEHSHKVSHWCDLGTDLGGYARGCGGFNAIDDLVPAVKMVRLWSSVKHGMMWCTCLAIGLACPV